MTLVDCFFIIVLSSIALLSTFAVFSLIIFFLMMYNDIWITFLVVDVLFCYILMTWNLYVKQCGMYSLYFDCEQTFRKKLFMSIMFCLFENYFDDECNFLYKLYVPLYETKNLLLLLNLIVLLYAWVKGSSPESRQFITIFFCLIIISL